MKKILLVCQASPEIGLGHLSRLTALAHALFAEGVLVPEILIFGRYFITDENSSFHTHLFPSTENFSAVIEKITEGRDFNAIAFDIREIDNTADFKLLLSRLKFRGIRLIAIDALLEYRNILDLIWVPSFNFDCNRYADSRCIIKSGWDSFLIRRKFPIKDWRSGPSILVLTGGSDVEKLSQSLPDLLENTLKKGMEINWVQGPFSDPPNIPTDSHLNWKIHKAPSGLDHLILKSNYVLTLFGVSLFEVMQYGVPAVVFSPYKNRDEQDLSDLSSQNVVLVAESASEAVARLKALMIDDELAENLSYESLKKLATNGAVNLASQIHQLLEV